MPNYLVSASDDAVVLRNYEGMLVRYQAEDKPNTIKPTADARRQRPAAGRQDGPHPGRERTDGPAASRGSSRTGVAAKRE